MQTRTHVTIRRVLHTEMGLLDLGVQKMDVGVQKMDVGVQKMHFGVEGSRNCRKVVREIR